MRRFTASFVRFALVGVCANVGLYGLYLELTHLGLGYKTAMTTAFGAGVVVTFVINRAWSFESGVAAGGAFVRYLSTYAAGYLANLVALFALVDLAGFRHEIVQAAMIVLIAIAMFVLQRYWVFRDSARSPAAPTPGRRS